MARVAQGGAVWSRFAAWRLGLTYGFAILVVGLALWSQLASRQLYKASATIPAGKPGEYEALLPAGFHLTIGSGGWAILESADRSPSRAIDAVGTLARRLATQWHARREAELAAAYDAETEATRVAGEKLAFSRRDLIQFLSRRIKDEPPPRPAVRRVEHAPIDAEGGVGATLDRDLETLTHAIAAQEAALESQRQRERDAWSALLEWRMSPIPTPRLALSGGPSRMVRLGILAGLFVGALAIGLSAALWLRPATVAAEIARIEQTFGLRVLTRLPAADESVRRRLLAHRARRLRQAQRVADGAVLLGGAWLAARAALDADWLARLLLPC